MHAELTKALFDIEALRTQLAAVEAERDRAMAGIENMERIRVGLTAERDAAQSALAGAMATAKALAEDRDKAVARSNFFEAEALRCGQQNATLRAEVERLREDSARAQWCEEIRAEVSWSTQTQKWDVLWYERAYVLRQVSHPDRDAAIDAAMKGGK